MRLGNKIRFTVTAVVGVLTVIVATYLPSKQQRDLLAAFDHEIQSLSETVALGIEIGLKSGDIGATQSAIEYAKKDPRVRFVALVSNGATVAAFPSGFVYDASKIDLDTLAVHRADVKSEALSGEIVIGASLASVNDAAFGIRMLAIVFGVLALGVGLVVAVWLARSVVRPIARLRDFAVSIGEGDLSSTITIESKDELGELAGVFNAMVEKLNLTVLSVRDAAREVAETSSTISSSTEQMAAGAQEQSNQAGEVASAVEEMTKTIVENSRNAGSASETARKAREVAQQGGQVVQETVASMKEIAEVVNRSAETVKALGNSSNQIGEIIGVIDDIADQTNLLALNAAIEAARAGEQGRGFAVVADEVRKLAERTTKATKEIASMIKAIQTDTSGAVTSMSEGTAKVDQGIQLADKAGTSLREIVDVSQRVTDMVAQIAAASDQQSGASEQISKNVESISTVTGETAQGVQQIARAAEDLNGLTGNLEQLVGKFKLRMREQSVGVHHEAKRPFDVSRKGIAPQQRRPAEMEVGAR